MYLNFVFGCKQPIEKQICSWEYLSKWSAHLIWRKKNTCNIVLKSKMAYAYSIQMIIKEISIFIYQSVVRAFWPPKGTRTLICSFFNWFIIWSLNRVWNKFIKNKESNSCWLNYYIKWNVSKNKLPLILHSYS